MFNSFERLNEIKGVRIERNIALSKLTTWKVGGEADALIIVESASGLRDSVRILEENEIPLFVLGNGSNVLVSDSGFRGAVIKLAGNLASISVSENRLEVGGGASLQLVLSRALEASLSGLEFLAGIPGTLGGAIISNAGAFGHEISDYLDEVATINLSGEWITRRELEGQYRQSIVPDDEVVTSAVFMLKRDHREKIKERIRDFQQKRISTQPVGKATAGSVFKNPGNFSAGELIEKCGLKGFSCGEARISDVHANFIVNEGGASASDIMRLIEIVQSRVKENFDIDLELEVKLLGF